MPHFTCTKRYGHERGLTTVFRQHRATSHCNQLHGYALSFEFEFCCERLDERGWVMDFGGLKAVKAWLETNFDHTLVVAEDDPQIDDICALGGLGVANVIVVERTGCEAFASYAFEYVNAHVMAATAGRVRLLRCTVAEHDGNSATYHGISYQNTEARV